MAKQTDRLLATGHQRHYSILYDNAVELLRQGLLGELHYIRAQWHRGNLPGHDSWQPPLPPVGQAGETCWPSKLGEKIGRLPEAVGRGQAQGRQRSRDRAARSRVAQARRKSPTRCVDAEKFGYQSKQLRTPTARSFTTGRPSRN